MDLRQKKTLRAIKNAFLQLRSSKQLEKISVTELVELAEISKATFYLHYRDIYDLSEQLQAETINAVYKSIGHPDWAITNPEEFAKELFMAFLSQKSLTDILFSGSQAAVLPRSIEHGLREHLFSIMPEYKNNLHINTLLTYTVQGGYYAYLENSSVFPPNLVNEEIIRISRAAFDISEL